jgi:RsiW-degrading membrane proteinase PrsW (M82 family)
VVLIEELTKFITYLWVTSHRKNSSHDYPIATLFYCMMSAAGFSIVENIYYLINWGEGVLFIRSITAIIMHLNCGIINHYFVNTSVSFIRIKISRNGEL